MKPITTAKDAISLIKDGDTVMIGGFLSCGSPNKVIDELIKQNVKDLTLVANDTSVPGNDRGKLIVNKSVKKVIAAHIGTNPETGRQMYEGELEVELVPMGTLIERIRAGGAGLGGVLTPTGIGTTVAEGKQIMDIDGKSYLLEKPLKADVAILYGTKVDKFGNVFLHGTSRNFNVIMATAANTVIVEADEIVEDCLDPDIVAIPGVLVDYIVA